MHWSVLRRHLLLGLALATPVHAHADATETQPVEVHHAGLVGYATFEVAASDRPAWTGELRLASTHTATLIPAAQTEQRKAGDAVHRIVRQRLPHGIYCADDSADDGPPSSMEVELRVTAEGQTQVSSDESPEFADCLRPLVAAWPLPPEANGTRTTIRYAWTTATTTQ